MYIRKGQKSKFEHASAATLLCSKISARLRINRYRTGIPQLGGAAMEGQMPVFPDVLSLTRTNNVVDLDGRDET
jgi:hypothetical protein